eukprot:6364453-Alexandrium_andersonii.AAC.1
MVESGPARDNRPPLRAGGRLRGARRRGEVREVLTTAEVRRLGLHVNSARQVGSLCGTLADHHASPPPRSRASAGRRRALTGRLLRRAHG